MEATLNVTLITTAKHGDLRKVVKHFGSQAAAAKALAVPQHTFCAWCNLKGAPPVSEEEIARSFTWTRNRVDKLERDLFAITNRTLEQIFPRKLRENKKLLRSNKTTEVDGEVALSGLLDYTQQTQQRLTIADPFESLQASERADRINEVLKTIPQRCKQVIELRYGLNGHDPMTLDEVSKVIKVTRERVRQIEMKGVRLMQQLNRSHELVGFVEDSIPVCTETNLPKHETLKEKYAK